MDAIETLEEAMKVLDVLSVFINKESDNFIQDDEIRNPIEDAFNKIYNIYDALGNDSIVEDLRDKWEAGGEKSEY